METNAKQREGTTNNLALRGSRLDPALIRDLRGKNYYIPQSIKTEITLHLLLNEIVYRDIFPLPNTPLILAVQGAPGIGKSWETITTCAELNVPIYRISGAALSGEYEADSSETLIASYLWAANKNDTHSVLLIEDLDTSPASSFGEMTTYTVNRQLLCGALMSLADMPTRAPGNDQPVRRTPIIATANDLEKVYQPLTRRGRMTIFDYTIDRDELVSKAHALLIQVIPSLKTDDILELLPNLTVQTRSFFGSPIRHRAKSNVNGTSSRNSISFFADLSSYCFRQVISDFIVQYAERRADLPEMISGIRQNQEKIQNRLADLNFDDLKQFAEQLEERRVLRNYLNGE